MNRSYICSIFWVISLSSVLSASQPQPANWRFFTVKDGLGENWVSNVNLAPGNAFSIFGYADGIRWVGASQGPLQYDAGGWSVINAEFSGVEDIFRDSDRKIRVASGSGIHGYADGSWITNTAEGGLPGTTSFFIGEDRERKIWVGTANGLSLYSPSATLALLRTIIQMASNPSGFPPDGEVRTIFSALDRWKQTRPERLHYSSRTDGEEWPLFEQNAAAVPNNQDYGRHTFEVRAMDVNLNIDPNNPALIESEVLLPWYREPFIIIIFSALLITLLIAYVIYRHRVLEKLVADRTKDLLEANVSLKNEHVMLQSMLKDKSFLVEIASTLNTTSSTYEELLVVLDLLYRRMKISHLIILEREIEIVNRPASVFLISKHGVKELTDECNFPMRILDVLEEEKTYYCDEIDRLGDEEVNFFYTHGMRSVCIFPSFRLDAGLVGTYCFGKEEEGGLCNEQIELLKAVSSMLLNAWWSYKEFHARLAAERKQTEAVKLAEKSVRMASIGVIAAGITHEINQPLNAIKITADRVLMWNAKNEQLLPRNYRRWLDSISGGVTRISEIIEQMRTYWVPPEEPKIAPLDLNAAVKNAITLVEQQLKAHHIELAIEERDKSLIVNGNQINLEQIVLNLVVNAIHALDSMDSSEKNILLKIKRSGEQAVFEVIDNGPGLTETDMQKLFDPFYTTRKPQQGMGLGLAIVKRFVDGFGGDVTTQIAETGGAHFIVTIPLSSKNGQAGSK